MFLTPVIYPVSFVPERWRWMLALNPLSGIIEAFRDATFGRPFNWGAWHYPPCSHLLYWQPPCTCFARWNRNSPTWSDYCGICNQGEGCVQALPRAAGEDLRQPAGKSCYGIQSAFKSAEVAQ